jgi:hypothetical protein
MYITNSTLSALYARTEPELRRTTGVPAETSRRGISVLEGIRRARKGAVVEFWYGLPAPDMDSGDWRAAETEGDVREGRFLPDFCYRKTGVNSWRKEL